LPPPDVSAATAVVSDTVANATAAVTAAIAASVTASVTASIATSTAASVAASTASSTAASAASSSVSSATSVKPGGAVPALMGAQRFAMYGGAAGGGQSLEAKSCMAYEPNLLMGRLGAWSFLEQYIMPPPPPPPPPAPGNPDPVGGACAPETSTRRQLREDFDRVEEARAAGAMVSGSDAANLWPLRRRRLQSKQKRSKGSGTAENAAVASYLLFVLADAVTTYIFIVTIVYTLHAIVANLYRYVLNRKFYHALAQETATGVPCKQLPKFRPLPSSLVYPRFEIMLATIFATGLMEAAANVLGTAVAEYDLSIGLMITALVVVSLVFLFLVRQAFLVSHFSKHHAKTMWQPAETIESYREMDDPMLRFLYRTTCCLPRCLRLKPVMRFKGEWAPPESATEEPGRTERALARSEWFGLSALCGQCCRWSTPKAELVLEDVMDKSSRGESKTESREDCVETNDLSASRGQVQTMYDMVEREKSTDVTQEDGAANEAAAEFEEVSASPRSNSKTHHDSPPPSESHS
jgi:hypothetical protein